MSRRRTISRREAEKIAEGHRRLVESTNAALRRHEQARAGGAPAETESPSPRRPPTFDGGRPLEH